MAIPAIVKIDKGFAKLYDAKGNYIKMLQANGTDKFVNGNITADGIHLTTDKGHIRIYDLKMYYKKTIY